MEEVELFKELLEKEGFEVSYFKDGKYPDVDFSWKIIRRNRSGNLFCEYESRKQPDHHKNYMG